MLRQETCRKNLLVYSQIAAESNSSECARILMEAGASAGTRDESGMTALTLMVTKMPSVVSKTNLSKEWTQMCTHFETKYHLAIGRQFTLACY